MRWQAGARAVVACIGIGTAVALYVMTRDRVVEEVPAIPANTDREATVQAGQSTQVRYRGSEREFIITSQGTRQYSDGRTAWIKAELEMDDGTMLSADEVETKGKSTRGDSMVGELLLKGHVRMQTAEGALVEADEGTYTDATGVAVMPGAVKFTRGRLSGTGRGGTYERDTGVFKLLADAHVTSAPTEEGGPVDATAQTMTFNRATKAMLFDGRARIAHDTQVMTADRATLFLADDNEQFRVVELRGGARVEPAPGQQSTVPDMQARDIDMSFHAGTQALERAILAGQATMVLVEGDSRRAISASTITLTTALDGKTVTHLDAQQGVTVRTPAKDAVPARTITSATLVASGDDAKGLTAAVFDGGVTFVENVAAGGKTAARERRATSTRLALKLRGQLDAIDEAQFQQNVRFRDGNVTGDADLGIYREAQGQLTLQPARGGKRFPRAVTDGVQVDANEVIDVDLNTQDVYARGNVQTVSTGDGKKGADAGSASLFNEQDPMYGFAREFRYGGAVKRAQYVGAPNAPASLKQGETVVAANDIVLVDETRDLDAKGAVKSTMLLTTSSSSTPAGREGRGGRAGTGSAATRYVVEAETLLYRDTARTAVYDGKPVTLTGPDGVTVAAHMVMTLAADSRTLRQLDASQDVRATLTDGRDALSDTLRYEAEAEKYTLRGQPFVLRSQGEKPGTCSIWKGRVVYFTREAGAPEMPPAENPGSGEKIDRVGDACSGALTR